MSTAGVDRPLGLLAEFTEAEQLVRAVRTTTEAGYRRTEAYSPFPVDGLAEALGFHGTRLPMVVLVGGVVGCLGGYALQYWASVIVYPLNIGGRPLNSWPMFVPVTFECTILVAALSCVLGMLALNGLPRPHHPLFDVEGFERASQDRFFLYVLCEDSTIDVAALRDFLQQFQPERISDVLRAD